MAMYKIGEFSKITNLTVKALRYYDEQEILKPSYRGDNEYRFYDEADFERARLIVFLRNLNFSISEVKDVLNNCDQIEDVSYFLSEKKAFIEKRMEEEKALIERLNHHLLPKNKEESSMKNTNHFSYPDSKQYPKHGIGYARGVSMNYEIKVKEYDAVNVSCIRYQGKYSDVGKYIGTIYKAVKNKADGAPFSCYYDEEYKEKADILLCVPTKGLIPGTGITAKQLPSIKAIATVHHGGYGSLNLAYKALYDYMKENNLRCKLPYREIYHKGPGIIFKGNPDRYVTEIALPIE
jgi:DNA-binding transcriptional MerR regulator